MDLDGEDWDANIAAQFAGDEADEDGDMDMSVSKYKPLLCVCYWSRCYFISGLYFLIGTDYITGQPDAHI